MFVKDNKLVDVVRAIKKIDQDMNGYALSSELNKIIRNHYPTEFQGRTINRILREYASI